MAALMALCAGAWLVAACSDATSPSTSTGPGPSGAGGCDQSPQPMLTLSLSASDGDLPRDTSIQVKWSAGTEPLFELDDASTWQSLDDGGNVICDVSPNQPSAPKKVLTCELWTSGATEITASATGYVRSTETFSPDQSDRCNGPIPTAVSIELRPDLDAGVTH